MPGSVTEENDGGGIGRRATIAMLCAAASLALGGCSILLDSGDHKGGRARDAATTDASSDGNDESDGSVDRDAQISCDPLLPVKTIPWRTCGLGTCSVCALSTQWLDNHYFGNVSNSEFAMAINPGPGAQYSLFLAYMHASPVYQVPRPILFDALASTADAFDLAEYARSMSFPAMARYDSIAIAMIGPARLGFVVTGIPVNADEASVWVGYRLDGESFNTLSPSKETGTVFGRAAVTLGGDVPRAYWRERNTDDEFFLGSVDIEMGSSKSFRRYDGPLVNQAERNIEAIGSEGALMMTEGRTSDSVILWNGDGGEPAEIGTPNRRGSPAMAYLGDDRYFVGWLEGTSPVRLHARQLLCKSDCDGPVCTRAYCCSERMKEIELAPLIPDLIAAHALPGGGVVVVADEGQGRHSTAHLMFLDDTLEHVRVGDEPTYSVMAPFVGADTVKSFQVDVVEGATDASFRIIAALAVGGLAEPDAFGVQVASIGVCQ